MIALDLHIHSKYSFDSLMRTETILKTARRKGLDIIAITDHGTIEGGLEASRLRKTRGMDIGVIVGAEILTNAGDIIGLLLNEEINHKDIGEVIDEIHSQGGLVLLPHPLKGHEVSTVKASLSKVDLVELVNSRSPLTTDEMDVVRGFKRKLVGFSDAHFPSEIGLCRTVMNSSYCPEDIDDIRRLLTEASPVTIKANFSSSFLVSCSQLIKSVRLKHYRRIPLNALYAIHQVMRNDD